MHQLAVAKMSSRGGDVVGSGIGATALVGNSATSLKGWQFALLDQGRRSSPPLLLALSLNLLCFVVFP